MAGSLLGFTPNVVTAIRMDVMRSTRWVEIILVLLAAWIIAGLFHGGSPISLSQQATVDASNTDVTAVALDTSLIRTVSLFGELQVEETPTVTEAPVVAKPVVSAVPPLQLKLLGTVVAGDHSVAILTIASNPEQKLIYIHKEIQPSVLLTEVFTDAVSVDDHGRTRRIELHDKSKSLSAGASTATIPTPPVSNPRGTPIVQRNISRKMLNSQMRNFSTLLSQAKVVPHFAHGKTDGFVISNIVPRSLYQKIGLRNGDIIRKVNQKVINNAAQAMQLYQSLQKASVIQLEVERAGQIQVINYHIQ